MAVKNTNKIWQPIDFTIYFKFIKWPVLVALILEITFRWWAGGLKTGLLFDQMELIVWVLRIAAFVIIARSSVKHFGSSAAIAAVSGIIGGFVIGFVISLFRFLDGVKIWKFFNIITETATVAVVGSLIAIFVIYASSIKRES